MPPDIPKNSFSTEKSILINSPIQLYTGEERNNQFANGSDATPYGLASIMTYVNEKVSKNINQQETVVELLDAEFFRLSPQLILEEIEKHNGHIGVVGLNITSPNFLISIALGQLILEKFPKTKIVFGGPHATLDPESILQQIPEAIVVRGDGEEPFLEIVSGKSSDLINGVVFSEKGEIIYGGSKLPAVNKDIDEVPWIDRTKLSNEPYEFITSKCMSYFSSFGCSANCGFCIAPVQREIMKQAGCKALRFRDITNVIAEISHNHEIYGADGVQFLDDYLFPNDKKLRHFLKEWGKFELKGKVNFSFISRAPKIKKHGEMGLLKKLRLAGAERISFGVETGYDRGRKLVSNLKGKIDPKYNKENILGAIKECVKANISTKGYFVLGFPGETKKETQKTIDWMYKLGEAGLNDVSIFTFSPYPHTQLYNDSLNQGFSPEELGDYRSQNNKEVLNEIKNGVSRGFTTSAQLCVTPPHELQALCDQHTKDFKKKHL